MEGTVIADVVMDLEGWEFLVEMPQVVAERWVIEAAPNAQILEGWTTANAPMKDWEYGRGIVVNVHDNKALLVCRVDVRAYKLFRKEI